MGRRQLAKTSRTPGKTRLANVFTVDDRLHLVDLPGYGYARVSKGMQHGFHRLLTDYIARRASLAGVVWLLDLRHPPSRDDLAMGERLGQRGVPVLAALTKADKIPRGRRPVRVAAIRRALELGDDQMVVTSAKTNEGIEELWQAVERLV